MSDNNTTKLIEELQQYKAEKEKIRRIIGQIGGKRSAKREKTITIIFVIALIMLVVLDICRHLFRIPIPLPPVFSLEIGVFLVSLKIIWMIHNQTRVEHFQFWILNSIEFRVNEISNRVRKIEKNLKEKKNYEQESNE